MFFFLGHIHKLSLPLCVTDKPIFQTAGFNNEVKACKRKQEIGGTDVEYRLGSGFVGFRVFNRQPMPATTPATP